MSLLHPVSAPFSFSAGISMEGDEELLANMDDEVTAEPKRDEWMTTLPPERKVRHLFFSHIGVNSLLHLLLIQYRIIYTFLKSCLTVSVSYYTHTERARELPTILLVISQENCDFLLDVSKFLKSLQSCSNSFNYPS